MTTPTFDVVVVGSGGGPDETNLSAYLLKPTSTSWEDGVIALEAGSGQGALNLLLQKDPLLFGESRYSAAMIYAYVSCYLITHAHLDHVNSLVISAGSLGGERKRIYASKGALNDLENIFAGRIWPNLATWDEEEENHKLLYRVLSTDSKYERISSDISVQTLPVSHGHNETGNYESSAFFIRHDPTGNEFLFFGDVEPDSVSRRPKTIHVWRAAAPKIPHNLSTIFIECSWPSGRENDALYGHLTPEHLADELLALAKEVYQVMHSPAQEQPTTSRTRPHRKRQKTNPISVEDVKGALNGVRIVVTHCKETLDGTERPIRTLIVEQIQSLVDARNLGCTIVAAEQGMHIRI